MWDIRYISFLLQIEGNQFQIGNNVIIISNLVYFYYEI